MAFASIDLPVPHLPGLDSIDFGGTSETDLYSTSSSLPMVNHPVHGGSSVDPWRTSTFSAKSNGGYPPAPSYLASPPLPSPDVPRDSNPEATRKDTYQWFLNLDTISITFAPEKEGIFLFKHTNYIIQSKVILNCLRLACKTRHYGKQTRDLIPVPCFQTHRIAKRRLSDGTVISGGCSTFWQSGSPTGFFPSSHRRG